MPARRELTMRQLRQMLRLHHDGVSAREIGRTLGVARSTIQDNLERARTAGIGWPLPAEWSDEVLEQRLFARSGVKPGRRRRREPDWTALARELKRPGVNLMVLWEEYRQVHPDGYGYSRFCDLYREFERRLSPVMRQHHVAGHKASFYDPEINRSYAMMAAHYAVGILPARPYRPRDKAKAEAGVRFAQTYILGRLRHQTFFSLAEANRAIVLVLERMNAHVMRRLGLSRSDLFANVERPALHALPASDYEFAEWRLARVGLDYHVEIESFYYSVPHALIRAQVDVRITSRTIEVFHHAKRVAAHQRRYGGPCHGTDPDHMPSAHRRYAAWSPERFQRVARSIGPNTEGLVIAVLANRPHPEQGFRTCLGVLRLFRGLDPTRAEAVAARALAIGALTYKSVASILKNNLDRAPQAAESSTVIENQNLRGPGYFH